MINQKVLYITARSDYGGGPKHLLDLMNYISKEKNYQLYCATPKNPPHGNVFAQLSTKCIEIPFRRFSIKKIWELQRLIKRENIQTLHTHGFGASIYGLFLKLFIKKWIHTFHGLDLKKASRKIPTLFTTKLADTVVCVSNSEREELENILGNRNNIRVIPNGVEISNSTTQKSPLSFEGQVHLGTLTRLSSEKGNKLLIDHFSKLSENFTLHIAGDGEERQEIEELIEKKGISNRVQLHGFVQDTKNFLNSIDIYVSASLGEGLPYAVLEATSQGIPCVLSNVRGHTDLSPFATLFDLNDSESFKKAIYEATPPNREKFQEIYEKSKCLEETVKLYELEHRK